MKIRNGFVSNSSSASFIISKNAYGNVFELAKCMIRHRGEEGDDDFYTESNKRLCNILEEERQNGIDPDTGISFPSCNFDTYIVRLKSGEFVVDTCNNHEFHVILEGIINSYGGYNDDDSGYIPDELKELGWKDIYDVYLAIHFDFFFPEFGVIGRRRNRLNRCTKSKCWGEKILLKDNNKLICPYCEMEDHYKVMGDCMSDDDKKIMKEFGRTFRKLDIK